MKSSILIILFVGILSTNTYEQETNNDIEYSLELFKEELRRNRIEQIRNSEFSIELFEELLSLHEVSYADYIVRQAILETGNFTSTIFLENNNLLGMKHPRVRPTTSLGSNRGHAKYFHWTESVEDYLLWLRYYKNRGWDTQDYFKFLREVGYAEDPHYIYKLQNLNYV